MTEVRAELIGNCWKVLVTAGETVAADQTLLILESMKMEIPVTAPTAGTVGAVLAREGEVVQEGQVLVTIDP
ncbi:MAG TPA: biotin/lipoyl-binding carrier protein [Candidatus Micrarchaeia archaeon]|nr:biotin/lipoyl-binding carrier protein [Candidatus Micrarchaeia archaeon]